jgi:sRNA-binding carbon storage regulator CsrA
MGLSITLQHGDSVTIGQEIMVTVYKNPNQPIRLYIDAPKDLRISRLHLSLPERLELKKKERENGERQ